MPRIIAFDCLVVIIWQLILLNFTGAQKEILKCMIKDRDNEIHLNLKKTNQLLANENLPIWIAKTGTQTSCRFSHGAIQHDLIPNFMKQQIGDFIMYHDAENSAAIVYFKNTGTLHGTVDARYVITKMPLNECNLGHQVGAAYVKRRESINVHDSLKCLVPLISPNTKISTHQDKPSTSSQYEPSKKRQRLNDKHDETPVTTLYPEILVFVSHDVTEYVKKLNIKNFKLTTLVRHYITFFNAVDMLLTKLSTDEVKIHLNLAGIVIESQKHLFPFIKIRESTPPNINSTFTLQTISDYLNANTDIFPDDSFDFYFLSTGLNLGSESTNDKALGISTDPDDLNIFSERQDPPNSRYFHGSIVQQRTPCEYVTASHEIAHLLGVKHDPLERGYTIDQKQCYSIMQEVASYCTDCIKWTDRNIRELEEYVRENQNRCFLLNSPRSLLPRGHPIKSLLPSEQCRCYGFEPRPKFDRMDHLDEIAPGGCNEQLICGRGSNTVSTILPLDGTPCNKDMVCWNRACQNLPPVSSSLFGEKKGW